MDKRFKLNQWYYVELLNGNKIHKQDGFLYPGEFKTKMAEIGIKRIIRKTYWFEKPYRQAFFFKVSQCKPSKQKYLLENYCQNKTLYK